MHCSLVETRYSVRALFEQTCPMSWKTLAHAGHPRLEAFCIGQESEVERRALGDSKSELLCRSNRDNPCKDLRIENFEITSAKLPRPEYSSRLSVDCRALFAMDTCPIFISQLESWYPWQPYGACSMASAL